MKECGQYYLNQREKIKENKRLNVKIVKNEKPAEMGMGFAESLQKVESAVTEESQAGTKERLSALMFVTGDNQNSTSKNYDDLIGNIWHTAVTQNQSHAPPAGSAFGEKNDIVSTSIVSSGTECAEQGSSWEAAFVSSHTNVDFLFVHKADDATCIENEESKHVAETAESGPKKESLISVSVEPDEAGDRGVHIDSKNETDTSTSGSQGNDYQTRRRLTKASRKKTNERNRRETFKGKNEAKEGTHACIHGG